MDGHVVGGKRVLTESFEVDHTSTQLLADAYQLMRIDQNKYQAQDCTGHFTRVTCVQTTPLQEAHS